MVAREETIGLEYQSGPYVVAFYVPTPTTELKELPPKWTWASCVEFAKWFTGHQGEEWGFAGDIEANSNLPIVGGLVLTNEGPFKGHTGVITGITETHIAIIEANYVDDQVSTRSLSVDSTLIRGYRNLDIIK